MRGRRLTILAAISLTCLAVLLCGYFATIGSVATWHTPINAQTAMLHIRGAGLNRGCCFIGFYDTDIPISEAGGANISTNFQVDNFLQFGWPEAGPSLFQFTARRMSGSEFILIFPIWCLAVPCTIAPILWWRRRRRRTARGFAVEVQAAGRS